MSHSNGFVLRIGSYHIPTMRFGDVDLADDWHFHAVKCERTHTIECLAKNRARAKRQTSDRRSTVSSLLYLDLLVCEDALCPWENQEDILPP